MVARLDSMDPTWLPELHATTPAVDTAHMNAIAARRRAVCALVISPTLPDAAGPACAVHHGSVTRDKQVNGGNGLVIRLGLETDVAEVREIERAAGTIFAAVGMPEIAEDEPPEEGVYLEAIAQHRLWVGRHDNQIIGYGLMAIVDGHVHLEQASIHPRVAGHGFGKQLICHMAMVGRDQGLTPVTLTTFADVPWNAPYYQTFGFEPLPESQCGPELRAILQAERDCDLGQWHRICMVMRT